jgi:iron complex transport system permease protein
MTKKVFTLSRFFILAIILCSILLLMKGETPLLELLTGVKSRLLQQSTEWNALLDERLPQLIVIISTGASLAVAGAVMQSLFQNPLASPSILGITSGGSLMVLVVFVLGLQTLFPTLLPIAAVLGCLVTLFGVFFISKKGTYLGMNQLVLTGIAISTILLALQGTILYAYRDQWQLIQTLTEWEAGTTVDRGWQHVHMQLPLTIVGLLGCMYYRTEINILALGDEEAANLGVEVVKVRWRLFLCVALLTGGALVAVGLIAFFGLVLPHIIRKLQGPDNRQMIPLCILGGAAVLCFLETMLRIFSIHAFAIGNISAIVGGIFFLFLLFKNESKGVSCPQR